MNIRGLLIYIFGLLPLIGFSQNLVEWTNLQNLTLTGDTLEKTSGSVGWNGNCNSTNILIGDGWISYNVLSTGTNRLWGFSQNGVSIVSDDEILYGFYTVNSDLYAREAGVQTYLNTTY
ncbi:MAG: hypothetical protein HRT73_16705, partial [Flavobacteriales bacterium]|nr:hypothetical protein [Flavobacteriales bacterium]